MHDILGKLFGSPLRVKIMRLFLLGGEAVVLPTEVAKRAKGNPAAVRKELKLLTEIGFIKEAMRVNDKKKREKGLTLNGSFPMYFALKNLILNTAPVAPEELLTKIKRLGKAQLVIISGIFIQEDSSRTDLFVVGDNMKRAGFERLVKNLEAEIGRELNYALLDTKEFQYRLGMYDKFVRDVLDYPHEKLLNKLDI
ncbi:MAG: helix-turn-helix transcriptional regulator [Candidatus Niyogibacteria bacterium]|nr:helix-turn-helix transcriptional regulator [Candidatus Niyogibacteria bacterium]